MEENQVQVQEQSQNIDYSKDFEELQNSSQEINKSINDLLKFFETEKQEQEIQEQKIIEQEKEQKIIEEKEQKEQEEEIKKEKEQQEEFYSNVRTIATNTDSEVTTQLLTDVSTLMQVNIMTSGLLIGIVCISLFAKFFKK